MINEAQMLRITETVENGSVVKLRLDGTITSESFAEIDRTCAHYRSEINHTVVLDMAGVTFMQTEPAQKLAQLKRDRLRFARDGGNHRLNFVR